MGSLLRYHAARKASNAAAIIQDDAVLTWCELEARSNRRAALYRSMGVGPGDFVTIALPNGIEFFEATFAVWKLGATPNPVPARLSQPEAEQLLALLHPKLVIADTEWACATVPGNERGNHPAPHDADEKPAQYWRAMMSGGSTGLPKLIVDHRSACHDPHTPVRRQPVDGVVLNPGPLYHSAPFLYAHMALFCGSTLINMPRFDAEKALALIEQHRVQWVNFVPTMMSRIWALPETQRAGFDLSSLEAVWHMGAPIAAQLKSAWLDWLGPERIWEGYGGTEGLGFTSIQGTETLQRPGSVGRLTSPQGQLCVLREDGSPCTPGETGEIHFLPEGGPGSTYHYLGATPRRNPAGWESFGELGWLDADGYLYLTDRRSDLILRGGANIYPAEVEAAIESHPDVAACAVIGLPDAELGQVVHAIVELHEGRVIEWLELHSFITGRLTPYKLPASYERAVGPIRNEAGKSRRSALRAERETWLREGRIFRSESTRFDNRQTTHRKRT